MSVAALRKHCRPVRRMQRRREHAGIYLLIAGDKVVYVGASHDAELRVCTHSERGRRDRAPMVFDDAIWIPLPVAVHPDYEGALIRALRPKYNQKAPTPRGHDDEILRGLDLGHLSTEGWKEHFEEVRRQERARTRTTKPRNRNV